MADTRRSTSMPLIRMARELGFGPRYRINLPQDADGVYTISSTSMSGEVDRPGDERTVHIDRHSGEIVAEVRFADYSTDGKGYGGGCRACIRAASAGGASRWMCWPASTVIFLCISGTAMWWLRRPARAGWLPVPPRRIGPAPAFRVDRAAAGDGYRIPAARCSAAGRSAGVCAGVSTDAAE